VAVSISFSQSQPFLEDLVPEIRSRTDLLLTACLTNSHPEKVPEEIRNLLSACHVYSSPSTLFLSTGGSVASGPDSCCKNRSLAIRTWALHPHNTNLRLRRSSVVQSKTQNLNTKRTNCWGNKRLGLRRPDCTSLCFNSLS
jgi:hypothetical protein